MNRLSLGLRTLVWFSAMGLVGCGGSGVPTAGGGKAGMGGAIGPSAGPGGRDGGLAGTTGQGGSTSAEGGRAGAPASASGEAGGAMGPGGAVGQGGSGKAGSDAAGSGASGGAPASAGGVNGSGGVPGGGGGGRAGGSMDGAAGAISSIGGASGRGGVAGGIGGGAGGAAGAGVTTKSCEGTAPCGGSLVGSWRFVSICLDEASISGVSDQILSACPGAAITNVATSHAGSIAFTASDYTATATTTLSFTLTLPVSCVGGTVRCADIGDQLATDTSVASASCSGSTVCTCALANTPVITDASGTYLTSGAVVTFQPSNGSPSTASYCVKADQLHILDVETITSMGSLIMRTRSDEVADRQ